MSRAAPKRSLKVVFPLWFVLSFLALAFITGVFLARFKEAINEELQKRLNDNFKVISGLFGEYHDFLSAKGSSLQESSSLIYYLGQGATQDLTRLLQGQMRGAIPQSMSVFSGDGSHISTVYRDGAGELVTRQRLDIGLSDGIIESLAGKDHISEVNFISSDAEEPKVEMYVTHRIQTRTGSTIGFVEQIIVLDGQTLRGLRQRLNLEIIIFDDGFNILGSSLPDFSYYPKDFLADQLSKDRSYFFELTVRDIPYGFITQTLSWGPKTFLMGVGATKTGAQKTVQEVTTVVLVIFLTLLIFLLLSSYFMGRVILRPLFRLLEATQRVDQAREPLKLEVTSQTELGLLTESFNQMSERIWQARKDLEAKVLELEEAYSEIKETQSKLVHSAKMASLGQLVAGIAHELNNPIGFIYSNMAHLREYGEKLVNIVEEVERSGGSPESLSEIKKSYEYDFIKDDLPKLISSCEEGARRTKDIVVGLRNFSRLEEAVLKAVQINDGLEDTLSLLVGELKNRIEVTKDYEELPLVECYASQINQVFMNILSNAAQAIQGEGEIKIKTWSGESRKKVPGVFISIADSGVGVDADDLEKIFDPFFTTKKVGQGTGLGLSISYGVIKSHGGDIEVKSKRGKGTEFVIFLPLKPQ